MTDLSVIVVNYRTPDLLTAFVESYHKYLYNYTETELIIVDVDPLESQGHLAYWDDEQYYEIAYNCGYAYACNYGASKAYARNYAFFNADTRFVDDECMDICVDYLDEHDDVAVVGPLQYNDITNKVTNAGIFGPPEKPYHRGWMSRDIDHYTDIQECHSVNGSAYFTKSKIWNEMTRCERFQQINPGNIGAFLATPLYYEEEFYSQHVQAHGYKVVYNGTARMVHLWNSSPPAQQSEKMIESQKIYREACKVHDIISH
jgi:GT2 family glycosyltransferase